MPFLSSAAQLGNQRLNGGMIPIGYPDFAVFDSLGGRVPSKGAQIFIDRVFDLRPKIKRHNRDPVFSNRVNHRAPDPSRVTIDANANVGPICALALDYPFEFVSEPPGSGSGIPVLPRNDLLQVVPDSGQDHVRVATGRKVASDPYWTWFKWHDLTA